MEDKMDSTKLYVCSSGLKSTICFIGIKLLRMFKLTQIGNKQPKSLQNFLRGAAQCKVLGLLVYLSHEQTIFGVKCNYLS